jgi:hypothetical protein
MLTTLAAVRARLGLTELEVQWDTLLANAILAVSARFDRECNRTFARTEGIEQEFVPGDTRINLRCAPVEGITRFELKTTEAEGWTEQTDVDYLIRHRCVLCLAQPIGADTQQARVIYTGGFVASSAAPGPGQTPLPADLEQAALEQVCWWFQNRDRLGLSRLWEYHGTYRHFGDLDLLTRTRAVLARHTRF